MSEPIAWHHAERLLKVKLEGLLLALETVRPEGLERVQGEIAGIRFALDVPEELRRELERRSTIPTKDVPHY